MKNGNFPDPTMDPPFGRVLSLTGRRFLYLINEKLDHLDIERNFYALILIEQFGEKITQQELAGLLESDKVSVVRIIDYLSENGYVERGVNSLDKRKYRLLLTEKAKKELPEIRKAIEEVTQLAFQGLSSAQIADFKSVLTIIRNNLNK